MDIHEEAIEAIRKAPADVVAEALDFLRFLTARMKSEGLSTAIASEPVLRREWDTPDEDEAWKNL